MKKALVAALAALYAVSCSDIFETDLSQEAVEVISPSDSLLTDMQTLFFLWEEVPGASGYHLQVAEESFSFIRQMHADTSLAGTSFSFTLPPGEYTWRVKAFNSTSSTPYETRVLQVDTGGNLGDQLLLLKFPADHSYTNKTSVPFSWYPLAAATGYHFRLVNGDFSGVHSVLADTLLTGPELSVEVPAEATLTWAVRAYNSHSESPFSETFTLISDTTGPAVPQLTSPAHGSTVSMQPFTFSWTRDASPQTSPLRGDSLFISSDTLSGSVVRALFIDGASQYQDSLSPGTYYWQVKTMDMAGNQGLRSLKYKLTIL